MRERYAETASALTSQPSSATPQVIARQFGGVHPVEAVGSEIVEVHAVAESEIQHEKTLQAGFHAFFALLALPSKKCRKRAKDSSSAVAVNSTP